MLIPVLSCKSLLVKATAAFEGTRANKWEEPNGAKGTQSKEHIFILFQISSNFAYSSLLFCL